LGERSLNAEQTHAIEEGGVRKVPLDHDETRCSWQEAFHLGPGSSNLRRTPDNGPDPDGKIVRTINKNHCNQSPCLLEGWLKLPNTSTRKDEARVATPALTLASRSSGQYTTTMFAPGFSRVTARLAG
jgi:hypothetical protein